MLPLFENWAFLNKKDPKRRSLPIPRRFLPYPIVFMVEFSPIKWYGMFTSNPSPRAKLPQYDVSIDRPALSVSSFIPPGQYHSSYQLEYGGHISKLIWLMRRGR